VVFAQRFERYHQSVYEQTTLKELYTKSRDSDQGAVTYAIEQVALQETKGKKIHVFFFEKKKLF
jgi:hypothetical protein